MNIEKAITILTVAGVMLTACWLVWAGVAGERIYDLTRRVEALEANPND